MTDVFISYSRKDRLWVKKLSSILEENGYSVWWDTEMLAGDDFRDIIKHELDKSKCVIVAWSKTSITSEWVIAEASEALNNKKLIPVFIHEVNPPMPFGNIHTEDLTKWNGLVETNEIKLLLKSVEIRKNGKTSKYKKEKILKKRYSRKHLIFILIASAVFIIYITHETTISNNKTINNIGCAENFFIHNNINNLDKHTSTIPEGTYKLGRKIDKYNNTTRKVSVDSFEIDSFEITNRQYKKYLDISNDKEKDSPSHWVDFSYKNGMDNYPVVNISWQSAKSYCEHLGKSLPTIDQWEVACNLHKENLRNENTCGKILPVGYFFRKKENMVYNINDNVAEWTISKVNGTAVIEGTSENIFENKVYAKGGSYKHSEILCSDTLPVDPKSKITYIGFRCVSYKQHGAQNEHLQ